MKIANKNTKQKKTMNRNNCTVLSCLIALALGVKLVVVTEAYHYYNIMQLYNDICSNSEAMQVIGQLKLSPHNNRAVELLHTKFPLVSIQQWQVIVKYFVLYDVDIYRHVLIDVGNTLS